MPNLLESLWYNYISQESVRTDELNAVSEKISRSREFLMGDLNNEQKEALLEYEDCLNQSCAVTEKEAFLSGVRFTAQFFLESMCL